MTTADGETGTRRLVFFGSGAFGVPSIAALHEAHELACIVTQPDRPAGRGGKLKPTPIAAWATEHAPDVPLLKPESVNEPTVREQIRSLQGDAWIVIAFGQKLGQTLLADRLAMNLHASRLPRWRGAAPINAAIVAGDEVTGNSVITLAERMDAGLVIARSSRPIEPGQTAGELHDLLAADGPGLLLEILASADPLASAESQDEAAVTLAPKLSRADAWVRFDRPAAECARRINGLSPWPGVQAELDGKPLKLVRSIELEFRHTGEHTGEILEPDSGLVACGEGSVLQLIDVQPAGKRAMPWADFARGHQPRQGQPLHCPGAPA